MADLEGINGQRKEFRIVGKPNLPGKIMRRTSLDSRIHQVMYFSEGCWLYEDYFFDQKTGVKLNTNMSEYKKSNIPDISPVDMAWVILS